PVNNTIVQQYPVHTSCICASGSSSPPSFAPRPATGLAVAALLLFVSARAEAGAVPEHHDVRGKAKPDSEEENASPAAVDGLTPRRACTTPPLYGLAVFEHRLAVHVAADEPLLPHLAADGPSSVICATWISLVHQL
ncbi:unnamed protein product, partial [Urochloa humidicola]